MNDSVLKYNAKLFSMLGQSASVFSLAIPALHDAYEMKVLSSDMSSGAGLAKYKEKYPQDFINVGIAEQNLIGVSAGISSEGFRAISVAQACFISMRSFEQIRQYLGYMNEPVVVVGINSGFALTYFGNTHYAVEDIALMRTIPNMTILSPSDAGMAVKSIEFALKLNTPVYVRLSGITNCPIVYESDFEYEPSKANIVYESGSEVTIFATGMLVANCIKAAKSLTDEGIRVKVVDVHCIKPMDVEIIKEAKCSQMIVTAEEHSVVGGLGSAVAECVSEIGNMPKLLKLGVNDCFSSVGDYNYLMAQHGLDSESIKDSIKRALM